MGFNCQKVGMIPAQADPEVQDSFKKKELEPSLEQAKQGKRAVFFAAHFVLSPFLGFLWTLTRIFIKAPSGRKRFEENVFFQKTLEKCFRSTQCYYP